MVLANVTYNTVDTVGFTNVFETIDTATTVKVTSSFSLNSVIPIIVIDIDKTPIKVYPNGTTQGIAKVTIRCIHNTMKDASDLAVLVEGYMSTAFPDFNKYGMQYREHKSVPLDFERGTQRLYGREIVYQFLVR